MRANSSLPGLIVAVLAMLAGCKPADEPTVLVAPLEPAESLEPAPVRAELDDLLRNVETVPSEPGASSQAQINEIRERPQAGVPTQAAVPPGVMPSPPPQKLFFQCADDVTFAVRTAGGRLEVSPPGFPNNFVALLPQPSAPGTYFYTADRAEFRFDGEIATLVLGRDRWADCVSNRRPPPFGARGPSVRPRQVLSDDPRAVGDPRIGDAVLAEAPPDDAR